MCDDPGLRVRRVRRAAEVEGAMAQGRQLGLVSGVVAIQPERDHLLAQRLAGMRGLVLRGVQALVDAGISLHVDLHELAHHRVASGPLLRAIGVGLEHRLVLLRQDVGQGHAALGQHTRVLFHVLDEIQLGAGREAVLGEVHDDVVALCDALRGQLTVVPLQVAVVRQVHRAVEGHGVFHQVAVVGHHVERDALVRQVGAGRAGQLAGPLAGAFLHQADGEVARDRAVQDTEAIAACAHVQHRRVLPVHQPVVAKEAVGVEGGSNHSFGRSGPTPCRR